MSSARLLCRVGSALFLLVVGMSSAAAESRDNVRRDPQAIAILSKVLGRAGGTDALLAIRDVTFAGKITYGNEESPEEAPVTVKLGGLHRFRMEAARADGLHVTVTGKKKSIHHNPDGSSLALPVQNLIKPASTVFPYFYLLAVAQGPSFEVEYLGVVTHDGQQAQDIRVRQTFAQSDDPMGWLSSVATLHIFVDPTTMLIKAIEDKAFRRDGEPGESAHEMSFADYQTINGIVLPMSATESIAGQPGTRMRFSQVSFNTNLSESEFD